ncbi:MAG: hypothetical protein QM725_12070 [Lacibacter sp.]
MAPEKQIIAFINPNKFAALFGNETPTGYFQNETNLNNGNHLVYVQADGSYEVTTYEETKAKSASIILVADTFNFQYVPEVLFKVLWHGGTDETTRVQRLRNISAHFQGDEKSQEEANTPYQKIADFINKKEGVSFESIYAEISEFDTAIENPLKKLATSLPFDYVYNNNADLRNAKSELEKAINKRLNK